MRSLAVLLVLLAGCDLYFNGGDDAPPPCGAYEKYPASEPSIELRDPTTGQCQSAGGGGCYDSCGGCQTTGPNLDFGACYGMCNALDEAACLTTPECLATYTGGGMSGSSAPYLPTFEGCFAIAPSGPVHGACSGLGAQECSRHDDCSMIYVDDLRGDTLFTSCAPELTTPSCSNAECAPDEHCEQQCHPCDGQAGPCEAPQCFPMCVPDYDLCAAVDCGPGYTCVTSCETMDSAGADPLCEASCVPTGGGDPGSCTGEVNCLTGEPACPANTTAGILDGCWTGYCIPNSACGPNDPGECTGSVACEIPAPACPAGTVAGILNACWSGFCIPTNACSQVTCEALTTEAACEAGQGCSTVYTGENCTCVPGGCTCVDLTFSRCEPGLL